MVGKSNSALVIGGSGSVGTAICTQLLQRGLAVFATRRRAEAGTNNIRWIQWQVGEPFAPDPALSVSNLRAVFYCVGTPSSKMKLLDTSTDEVTRLFAVNATGMPTILASLKDSIRSSATSIVVVSSDATTSIRSLNGPYSASKTALEVFARTIAVEEKEHGVRVNVVCPSLIESPMGDMALTLSGIDDVQAHKRGLLGGRAISPGEVANVAISIALSPEWSLCSGQVFRTGAPPR